MESVSAVNLRRKLRKFGLNGSVSWTGKTRESWMRRDWIGLEIWGFEALFDIIVRVTD